jgi:spore maturation protein CgeB
MSPNVRCLGHVTTAEHNAFNCSTRAVLNVTRAGTARYGFAPATRLFEAAGAAACLITDDWPGLEAFFEPGTEILVAHNGDEVARQVDRLSAGVARKIGRAARARALAEHTYAHRAAQFDAVIEGRSVGRPLEVMA